MKLSIYIYIYILSWIIIIIIIKINKSINIIYIKTLINILLYIINFSCFFIWDYIKENSINLFILFYFFFFFINY